MIEELRSRGIVKSIMREIETVIEADHWHTSLPDAEDLANIVHKAARKRVNALDGGVALLLTDNDRVQSLNRDFRNKDKPTNVLSFPSGEAAPSFLGDIALGYSICLREADEARITLHDHAAHLILHGLLHLVGYDHQTDEEADEMERMETEILATIGVADPYSRELK